MYYLYDENISFDKNLEYSFYPTPTSNKYISPSYSSGIVNRPSFFKTLRLTFLNSSFYLQNFNFSLYDWTSGMPVLIESTNILLNQSNGKVIDILLKDQALNIELYEIKISPYYKNLLINSYNI